MRFISKSKRFSKNRFIRTSLLICFYNRFRNCVALTFIMSKGKK